MWYLLGDEERVEMGDYVAIAVAENDMSATLVRDYLMEHKIPAVFPPSSYPIYPLESARIRIWVPKRLIAQAEAVLKELESGWVSDYEDEANFDEEDCVGVVGAGSWGTALAHLLGSKGIRVWLWGRNPGQMEALARTRRNERYLPDALLPDTVQPTCELERLSECRVVVLAVPSGALRAVMNRLPKLDALYVIATKGLEPHTGKLLTEVAQESLGVPMEQLVVLSGPNLAVELVRGIPTASVASSVACASAERVQELFMTPTLRVYTNDDVVGVELGGALKNVYAIGSGMSDGMGFGDNTKGTLLTRGLAEMMRFGVAMGACPETFIGLTGVGDLFATAVSKLSRNYRLGRAVAQGKTVDTALAELGQVAEGYPTALVAKQRAQALGVEMPLLSAIADILSGERAMQEALHSLMTRPPKDEREFRFVQE